MTTSQSVFLVDHIKESNLRKQKYSKFDSVISIKMNKSDQEFMSKIVLSHNTPDSKSNSANDTRNVCEGRFRGHFHIFLITSFVVMDISSRVC